MSQANPTIYVPLLSISDQSIHLALLSNYLSYSMERHILAVAKMAATSLTVGTRASAEDFGPSLIINKQHNTTTNT